MLNAGQNVETLMKDMEATAARMRELIVGMPPEELVGYIYAQLMMTLMQYGRGKEWIEFGIQSQFLLEYTHAVLATDLPPKNMTFSEEKCKELFKYSSDLYSKALCYATISSLDNNRGVFGSNTSEIEVQAKSTWVTLRSNRYLKLEGEFYRYVLAPHDEVLKEVYGVDALAIASGF